MKTVSATEAKNNFGAVLEALASEPVEIVKNGKPVAVVISVQSFDEMGRDYAMTTAMTKLAANDHHVVSTLIEFSKAEISSEEAMRKLELKNRGQLLDLWGLTSLPFPSIAPERIASMVDGLLREGQTHDQETH
jgi:prevent-host-death family protein